MRWRCVGRTFFESLDRDADGMVTLDDMKHAMKQFKLPENYAKEFLNHARGGKWWEKSITYGHTYARLARSICAAGGMNSKQLSTSANPICSARLQP